MPPRRDKLPLLKCNLCSLTTKNAFIFKRHRQRCVREQGAPSEYLSALKPTGQLPQDHNADESGWTTEQNETIEANENDDADKQVLIDAGSNNAGNPPEGKDLIGDSQQDSQQASSPSGAASQRDSQQGASPSGAVPTEESLPDAAAVTSRLRSRSTSDLDTSTVGGSAENTSTVEPQESQEMGQEEEALPSKSGANLPPPSVSRHYSCGQCDFTSGRAKAFLRHKIEQHNARIHIFSCTYCEYASQYKHKLERHITHAHVRGGSSSSKGAAASLKAKQPAAAVRGTKPRLSTLLAGTQAGLRGKRLGTGQGAAAGKSGQTLESLLVKLRAQHKVTDANLSSFYSVSRAMEASGGDAEVFKCRLCLFTARCKNKVLRHLQACHVNARLFRCSLCTFRTHGKSEFYAHKKKHTSRNSTMFKCKECAYATEFRPNYERHMLQHGCLKPNKCTLCSYATDHEGALKRHVTSHHPNTAENQSLIIAGDGADTGPHGNAVVDGNDAETEEGLESDGFQCPICSLSYRRCADLNRHMKHKHAVTRKEYLDNEEQGGEEEVLEVDDGELDDMEVEEMDDSEEDFEESQPLSELLRLKGLGQGSGSTKLKCSYCSYLAKWPSDLRRHMRVHSVVKRFKCTLCWKKYKYLGDLNVHMRRDHEVNPDQELTTPQKVSTIAVKKNSPRLFRCPACPFFTKVKVDMDRHSHKHTEAKTYRCKLCTYETYWRGDMGRHLYRKHATAVSKDADLKEFFLYRPERRALTKGGTGISTLELVGEEGGSSKETQGDAADDKVKTEDPGQGHNEDSNVSDTLSFTDSLSNCSETTLDKDGHRLLRCQLCSFTNVQAHKMKNHMDTHLNLKQFKCPVCGHRGNWKYDIRKHMASKHPKSGQEVIALSTEEARATIQEYLATRPNIKRDHHLTFGAASTMLKASKPSSATSSLQQHNGGKHETARKTVRGAKKVFEYKCSHCQFRSRVRDEVSQHQRSSHADQPGTGILAKAVMASADLQGGTGPAGEGEKDQEMETSKEETGDATLGGNQDDNDDEDEDGETEEMGLETMEVEEEEGGEQEDSVNLFRCAECGKQGVSKGAIKKHYNYIHPSSEVRIISVATGVEFNYYTGLPTTSTPNPSSSSSTLPKRSPYPSPTPISKATPEPAKPAPSGDERPYQCSVCMQRSNWKWDVKKHLRVKHPGTFGYVIMIQPGEPKNQPKNQEASNNSVNATATFNTLASGATMMNTSESGDDSNASGDSKAYGSADMPYKSQEMLLGRYRRYKCSGCGYRSNWRTDICRHIERRHKDSKAKVIFMDVEEAKQSFMDYHYNPPNLNPHTPGASSVSPSRRPPPSSSSAPSSPFKLPSPAKKLKKPATAAASATWKVWHCPKCPFESGFKSHIVSHMQEHGMKPFHCTACGTTARFRSPMYRHIRKQHNSTAYTSYAKIVIKFTKPAQQQQQQQKVALKAGGGKAGGGGGGGGGPPGRFVESYLCRLCTGNTQEAPTHEDMMRHVLSDHGSTDASQALKIKKKVGGDCREDATGVRAKRYLCTICPYRTDKRGMLTFHHAYHQPTAANKYKCRYCPYYVCASRLLHQHMSLHDEFLHDQAAQEASKVWRKASEKTPPSSPSKRKVAGGGAGSAEAGGGTPKRHNCEKCPYNTNSKNDFIYHKQFHRPKPAAEYKCDHCDYWVTHRRLLKQHVRLHGEEFPEDSLTASPSKSLTSDASAVLDFVEIAAIKQKMISNKITASLSTSPAVSPMKMAAQCSAGNRPGFVLRNGMYKKLHQCSKCPYTNMRSRNVRLHELMHGFRQSEHHLSKCPYCDYYVGAKGLLSHHMKVHQQKYRPDPGDSTTFDLERKEKAPGASCISSEPDEDGQGHVFASPQIPHKYKVDTLLEISRFKKYSCEKCPYASGKRSHFMRHLELHGSKQRHTCQYCDYSVPSITLLLQHQRIHLMPNQNLLATQSFSNLQHLKEVPADVALASALPPTDISEPVTISVIHDHLELYENDDSNALDSTPRKLYRCDRCPYANVRRDHLLTHMRFHLTKNAFHCPYCNYSAPKQQLLTQHIRVHFCPLPELSDWLIENGQNERAHEVNDLDLTQALEVAEKFQTSSKRKLAGPLSARKKQGQGAAVDGNKEPPSKKAKSSGGKDTEVNGDAAAANIQAPTADKTSPGDTKKLHKDPQPSTSAAADKAEKTKKGEEGKEGEEGSNMYICQYCDREFPSSKLLIGHELQHLIGNHFEFSEDEASGAVNTRETAETTEAQENRQHVAEANNKEICLEVASQPETPKKEKKSEKAEPGSTGTEPPAESPSNIAAVSGLASGRGGAVGKGEEKGTDESEDGKEEGKGGRGLERKEKDGGEAKKGAKVGDEGEAMEVEEKEGEGEEEKKETVGGKEGKKGEEGKGEEEKMEEGKEEGKKDDEEEEEKKKEKGDDKKEREEEEGERGGRDRRLRMRRRQDPSSPSVAATSSGGGPSQ